MHSKSRITAIGTYVPDQILSNIDLEKMIDTNDEWIVQRTGKKEGLQAKTNTPHT